MSLHELVIEDGEMHFHCNAKPENGNSPECWFSYEYDDEGKEVSREDQGECNAGIWISELGFGTDSKIHIPVDLEWHGEDGLILTWLGEVAGDRFEHCRPKWLQEAPDVSTGQCFIAEGRVVHNRVAYHIVESSA